jgi:hypothetical protein
MPPLALPAEITAVFREFRTCEFSTLAKDGTPITWPTVPFFDDQQGQFAIATSIALAQKAINIRRRPRVSLLFSDPTGSGLTDPPAVLVQGDAIAPDEIITDFKGYEDRLRLIFERQPSGGIYSSNPLMRYLFDWYYMRLGMYITPRRIFWWERGDFTRAPHDIELSESAHVERDR